MLDFTIYIDHVIQASRHDIIVKKEMIHTWIVDIAVWDDNGTKRGT